MEKDKADRRVRYTKKALENAMVVLLQARHISKISVKSLCDIADVNRSTFYTHYADQYDLLEQMSRDALDNIKRYLDINGAADGAAAAPPSPVSVTETNLKMILEYAKRNSELVMAFLSDNCDTVFQKKLMEMLDVIPTYINFNIEGRVRDYLTGYMMSGCISILKRWLQEGTPEPTREMTEIILQVINNGLAKFTK